MLVCIPVGTRHVNNTQWGSAPVSGGKKWATNNISATAALIKENKEASAKNGPYRHRVSMRQN